jgi:aminoglycoside N3'-acetyltransferase
MTSLKRTIMDHLPGRVSARLRDVRRAPRRLRYRIRSVRDPEGIDQREIERALRRAGIERDDAVFFQASMKAFGVIRRGPEAVIAALEEVVGPDGLIAMPAFPIVGRAVDHLAAGEPFDVRSTPSRMGAITERFRGRPGAARSLHPTHSVTALGPGADELVAGHADAETPFGAGTPFARLLERDAVQVWFGCGVGPFTIYHTFECLREDGFPLPVFLDEPVSATCVDADGRTRQVRTLVHNPKVSRERVDNNAEIAERVREQLLARGSMRSVRLGDGEILAVRLTALMDDLEELLAEGSTIYPAEALVGGPG